MLPCMWRGRAAELYVVIGGGTNLIVSDEGFRGIVLRFTARRILAAGDRVVADSGAVLQDLVDFTVERGLKGMETLAGIPGSVGAAIYGNAGAYGHSISELVRTVRFYDGRDVRVFDGDACEFHYRESIFKRHKEWIIFSTELALAPADASELRKISGDIVEGAQREVPRDHEMRRQHFQESVAGRSSRWRCRTRARAGDSRGQGSGGVFSGRGWRQGHDRGDIHVANYHANLIYNGGDGTAADLRAVIAELKARVREKFSLTLEEEVQYVGFPDAALP